jgi:hypothetical protein
MDQQHTRKAFKYRLMPTPVPVRALETVLWRCRDLYNAGLQERKAAWEQCRVSVTFAMQSAQLPALAYVHDRQPEAGGDAAGTGSVRLVPDLVVEIASSAQQRIRMRLHRPLAGTPKTVTIRREADGVATTSMPMGQLTGHRALKTYSIGPNPHHIRAAGMSATMAKGPTARLPLTTLASALLRLVVSLVTEKNQ